MLFLSMKKVLVNRIYQRGKINSDSRIYLYYKQTSGLIEVTYMYNKYDFTIYKYEKNRK